MNDGSEGPESEASQKRSSKDDRFMRNLEHALDWASPLPETPRSRAEGVMARLAGKVQRGEANAEEILEYRVAEQFLESGGG